MTSSTAAATVRTRVRIPLSFADGYQVTAEVVTFNGLADGAEHVALVLGDPATAAAPLVRLPPQRDRTRDPGGAGRPGRLGAVEIPSAATYPLDRVAGAFAELEQRHTRGKIVLMP
ncbi:zinc-binding dehydrogenase [Streptomyces griseoruber]